MTHLENPMKNPLENPNLISEQDLGKEPGSIEFEKPDPKNKSVPNPDGNPTKEKGPAELPGRDSSEGEILRSS